MTHVQGFSPISRSDARKLILGSAPGDESLRISQYYADPGNKFWEIMGYILGFDSAIPYEDRVQILRENHIALWDVLKECVRKSSQDKHIVKGSKIVNDFSGFLSEHPDIDVIYFNGRTPEDDYKKMVLSGLPKKSREIKLVYLLSSSGSLARKTPEKIEYWRDRLELNPHQDK